VADEPTFRVPVAIRCFHRTKNSTAMEVCGAAASWCRPGATGNPEYFCDEHRRPTDEPIAFAARVPRLSVFVEMVCTGTSWHPAHAKAEALERLCQAVQGVGAVLNVHSVLMTTGRSMRQPPEGAQNAGPVGG